MTTHIFNNYHANYTVEVEPKKSITVTRDGYVPNTFKIGDRARYDLDTSSNVKYEGVICSITDKTITIEEYSGWHYMNKKYRLKLEKFAWYNYNFNKSRVNSK